MRYLDRLGRPEVGPDGVLLTVGGDRPSALTQARFDKPLPVALHAEYALDGAVVPAADIPGAPGDVRVTYTLTNTTATRTDLAYTDASGAPQVSNQPVFAPFQGIATVTLPAGAQLIDDGGAMLATDQQGRTVARWNVALYPPISSPIQRIGFTMRTTRAAVPAVTVELTPATSDQDPGTGVTADLLGGATAGNESLYDGLAALDAAAGRLALGSAELSTGLVGLADGTDTASGAASALADGVGGVADGAALTSDATRDLADGVGALSGGASDVADGTAKLAGALGTAAGGATSLAEATRALAQATGRVTRRPAPAPAGRGRADRGRPAGSLGPDRLAQRPGPGPLDTGAARSGHHVPARWDGAPRRRLRDHLPRGAGAAGRPGGGRRRRRGPGRACGRGARGDRAADRRPRVDRGRHHDGSTGGGRPPRGRLRADTHP